MRFQAIKKSQLRHRSLVEQLHLVIANLDVFFFVFFLHAHTEGQQTKQQARCRESRNFNTRKSWPVIIADYDRDAESEMPTDLRCFDMQLHSNERFEVVARNFQLHAVVGFVSKFESLLNLSCEFGGVQFSTNLVVALVLDVLRASRLNVFDCPAKVKQTF